MKFQDPRTGNVFDVEREGATAGFCARIECSNCPIPDSAKMEDCSDWIITYPTEAARLMGYEVIDEEDQMDKQDKPVVFMDGICPRCGELCGNGGIGDTFHCECGWSGKMDEGDTRALAEFIRRHKERNKEVQIETKDKPRICEVLGVEVGERAAYSDPQHGEIGFEILSDGNVSFIFRDGTQAGQIGMGYAVVQLINHPDRIIRKPKFTAEEEADARSITRLIDGSTAAEIERLETHTLRIKIPLGVIGARIVELDSTLFPSVLTGQSVALVDITGGAE